MLVLVVLKVASTKMMKASRNLLITTSRRGRARGLAVLTSPWCCRVSTRGVLRGLVLALAGGTAGRSKPQIDLLQTADSGTQRAECRQAES